MKLDIQMFSVGGIVPGQVYYHYNGNPIITSVDVEILVDYNRYVISEYPSDWKKVDKYLIQKHYVENISENIKITSSDPTNSSTIVNNDTDIIINMIGKKNPNQKAFGFTETKEKKEVYSANEFVILRKEVVLTKNTTDENKDLEKTGFTFNFPDSSWNSENTRVLEVRKTQYNFINGNYVKNHTKILGDTQDTYFDTPKNYLFANQVDISSTKFTPLGEKGDISFKEYVWAKAGDKIVYEVLLMKIDTERVITID